MANMMNLLIPMAGAGSRFTQAGYTTPKPLLSVTQRRTGRPVPMVVAAMRDLTAFSGGNIQPIAVMRHEAEAARQPMFEHFPNLQVVTASHLTDGQASSCLLAKTLIDNDRPLLIGACDHGMEVDVAHWDALHQKADALILTFRHDPCVNENPNAYGWVKVDNQNRVLGMSVKMPISQQPQHDHAVTGAFWFRRGSDFVRAAEAMIAADDRINGEFYVDQVMQHMLAISANIYVCETSRYFCWGTPEQYEHYEATLAYWRAFYEAEQGDR